MRLYYGVIVCVCMRMCIRLHHRGICTILHVVQVQSRLVRPRSRFRILSRGEEGVTYEPHTLGQTNFVATSVYSIFSAGSRCQV